ncbi:Hypothetical predicted protein [Mytilus galloprovincialis]|uniref:B box-type domain-containing protein n=1 Tax=Mytilus galloprovincialis TaxID=29158 RepID=A0A8B6EPE2_MYTGA|nr:Hypothetical predicted protein [Mytilus galloprovincialis]
MATGGHLLCDICNQQDITTDAVEYCPECEENLCQKCTGHHKVAKLSRKHETVALENVAKLPKFVNAISSNCNDHYEKIEYFCNTHSTCCCVECLQDTHKKCHNLTPIQKVIKNVKSSPMFCDQENILSDLLQNIDEILEDRRKNIGALQEQEAQFKIAIQCVREAANEYLDNLETALRNTMQQSFNQKKAEIENLVKDMEKRKKKITEMKENVDLIKSIASDFQSFIAIRQTAEEVHTEEVELMHLVKDDKFKSVEIRMIPTEFDLLTDHFDSIGKVQIISSPCKISMKNSKIQEAQLSGVSVHLNSVVSISVEKIKLIKNTEFSLDEVIKDFCALNLAPQSSHVRALIKHRRRPFLVRECISENGNMLILDCYFSMVFCLTNDAICIRLVNVCPLSFIPGGIISLSPSLAIITEQKRKRFHFITIKNAEIWKTVECETVMLSVSYKFPNLLVQNGSGGFSQVNKNGKVLSETKMLFIDEEMHQSACFQDRFCFISYDAIHCCEMAGNLMWQFRHGKLLPNALTTDGESIIFAVSCNGSIYAISANGKSFSILVEANKNLLQASAVHYDKDGKKLLVSTEKGTVFLYDVHFK